MAIGISVTAPAPVWRVGNIELGFIKVQALSSEAAAQVPKGWYMASSNEVSLGYRDVPESRQALIDAHCGVWTSDMGGIRKSGERIILEDGSRVELKPGQNWSELGDNEKAYEGAGAGRVVVVANGGTGHLLVYAWSGPRYTAWVAVARQVAAPQKGLLRTVEKGGMLIAEVDGIELLRFGLPPNTVVRIE